MTRLSGWLALLGLALTACTRTDADAPRAQPTAPVPPASGKFLERLNSGDFVLETYDFEADGFWTLSHLERDQWMKEVLTPLVAPQPDLCGMTAQRHMRQTPWLMIAMYAKDAAEWRASAEVLRRRLQDLDAALVDSPGGITHKDPRIQELLVRRQRAQDVRSVDHTAEGTRPVPPLASQWWIALGGSRLAGVDCENTQWLRTQLAEVGWFTISKFGAEADAAAGELAQHAFLDAEFQQAVLEKLQSLPRGQTSPKNIAYLWDRVANNGGKAQRYGTLGTCGKGSWTPYPSEDPGRLDRRRAAAGLEPIADYALEQFRTSCPQ